jgi:hypothetical protein
VKYRSTADVVIVLAGLAGIHVDWRYATPVVTRLKPKPDFMHFRQSDIKPHSALQDAGSLAPWPGVGAAVLQVAAGLEVAKPAAEADPGRKRQVRNKGDARRRGDEKRAVLLGYCVQTVVQVFVRIEDDRDF